MNGPCCGGSYSISPCVRELTKRTLSRRRIALLVRLFLTVLNKCVSCVWLLEDLASKKRYSEAAQVLLDYAKDIRNCVDTLAQGHHFAEAHRIVRLRRSLKDNGADFVTFQITLHGVPDLVLEILHPASLDSRTQISEDLEEMWTQLRKQVARLRELRVKKIEEPGKRKC